MKSFSTLICRKVGCCKEKQKVFSFSPQQALVPAFAESAMEEAGKDLDGLLMCDGAYHAMEGADLVAILTEWNEFRALDLDKMKSFLKEPIMVDLRNIYSPEEMAANGITYVSVGRGRV